MCKDRVIAPTVLLRCACALQAAELGSSCSGSSTERSSAPGAGMTKYENESDLLRPFPRLTRSFNFAISLVVASRPLMNASDSKGP